MFRLQPRARQRGSCLNRLGRWRGPFLAESLMPPTPSAQFLPFRPESLDLVMSNLSMHWINDLPDPKVAQTRSGAAPLLHSPLLPSSIFSPPLPLFLISPSLLTPHSSLLTPHSSLLTLPSLIFTPDGLFMASMLGGDTLIELRHAIA
eukprot:189408-Hanusia_phi.AAC.2